MEKNVQLKKDFEQVCVMEATLLGDTTPSQFEEIMYEDYGVRVQYLEEVERVTCRSKKYTDLLFAVHNEDKMKFAVPRLLAGIRWIEDVYGNGSGNRYPRRVADYLSWDGYRERFVKDKVSTSLFGGK